MKFSEMPYQRVDLEETSRRFEEIIEKQRHAASGEEQFEIHKEYYRLMDEVETYMTLASIRHDIDTTDEFYEKERNYYDEIGPVLNKYIITYKKVLFESPFRPYMEEKIGAVTFKSTHVV